MPPFFSRLPLKAEHRQFAIAGVVGLLVDVVSLYFFLFLGCNRLLARVLAFLLAVFTTWQINRRTTFRDAAGQTPLLLEFARYLFAMIGGGMLNLLCSSLLLYLMPAHPLLPLVAVGIGSIAGMGFNFCAAKWFVFK